MVHLRLWSAVFPGQMLAGLETVRKSLSPRHRTHKRRVPETVVHVSQEERSRADRHTVSLLKSEKIGLLLSNRPWEDSEPPFSWATIPVGTSVSVRALSLASAFTFSRASLSTADSSRLICTWTLLD